MNTYFKWSFAAVVALILSGSSLVNAAILLDDDFDNSSLATNAGGVGTGWTTVSGGTAVESGTVATLSKDGGFPVTIRSNDPLDPTGTTMTWVINSRTNLSNDLADVGWVKVGGQPHAGSDQQVRFQMRTNRALLTFDGGLGTVFNIPDGNAVANAVYDWDGSTPVTVTLFLDATTYHLTATGTGVSIDQTGISNFATLLAGAGGTMQAFAAAKADAGGSSAVFDSVLVTSVDPVPEPGTFALAGMGLLTLGLFVWRRQYRGNCSMVS